MSVNERVYSDLKESIISSRLRPGQRLGHHELATMLNTSRTPVREALERLSQEGFVTHLPRRGFVVAQIDTEMAKNLYQTREALEVYALGLAMDRGITAAEFKKLEQLNKLYGSLMGSQHMLERQAVDRDMHLAMAALSGNPYLVEILASIFEKLMMKRRIDGYYSTERGPAAADEHALLFDAMKRESKREATRLLQSHLRDAWKGFETHLKIFAAG